MRHAGMVEQARSQWVTRETKDEVLGLGIFERFDGSQVVQLVYHQLLILDPRDFEALGGEQTGNAVSGEAVLMGKFRGVSAEEGASGG